MATLGMLSQISDNNISIRMANGQDMGVRGSVMVNFKIGPSSFSNKFVVCEGLTRPFIVGEKFLSHHCFTVGWTDENRRFAEYKNKVIAVASQTVMDDRIIVSHLVQIPVRNFAMVPTKYPNMFQVEWKHVHAMNSELSSQTYTWNQCNTTMQMVSGKMPSPT